MKVVLGTTGSVASVLVPKLALALKGAGHEVQVAATESSLYFFEKEKVDAPVWRDRDEWPEGGYTVGDPILHTDLKEWGDLLLIAPLSANTLAKLSLGLADNLLTSTARAWRVSKPFVVGPAMNPQLWEHPATEEHLARLKAWYGDNFEVVEPVSKVLACREVGKGAVAAIDDIVIAVSSFS